MPCFVAVPILLVAKTEKFREYWMIYRGPGFLVVMGFGSLSNPSPPSQQDVFHTLSVSFCVRGGDGQGAKSYDREKAWPSIYHSNAFLMLTRRTLRIMIDIEVGLGMSDKKIIPRKTE
jgi:hypothetical protein